MFYLKFVVYAAILLVLTWFIADGLLWLDFKFKPYTLWMKNVQIWCAHIAFIIISLKVAFVWAASK